MFSDADDSAAVFQEALGAGCDVVTANKKPLADSKTTSELSGRGAAAQGVGSRRRPRSGPVCPSSTPWRCCSTPETDRRGSRAACPEPWGYLTSRLSDGAAFSEAVIQAKELGYTEPDPAADLSGADVGRKAAILARLSGLGAAHQPLVEGFVPPDLVGLPWEELAGRLRDFDGPMADRMAQAQREQKVLRYVARIEASAVSVGPELVPVDSALGQLQGTDNMVVFHLERYRERPLWSVVRAPGSTSPPWGPDRHPQDRGGEGALMGSRRDEIRVFAPATVANLGPGFDLLGSRSTARGTRSSSAAASVPGYRLPPFMATEAGCRPGSRRTPLESRRGRRSELAGLDARIELEIHKGDAARFGVGELGGQCRGRRVRRESRVGFSLEEVRVDRALHRGRRGRLGTSRRQRGAIPPWAGLSWFGGSIPST